MNILLVLFSTTTFSDVLEDVTSKNFSFAPLVFSELPFSYVDDPLNLQLIEFAPLDRF